MEDLKWCPEGWEGQITYKKLHYKERMRLVMDCGFHIGANGTMDKMDNLIEVAIKNFEICEKIVTSVNLKHIETGVTINSLDELGDYAEGNVVINSLGQMVMAGSPLVNSLRQN